MELFEVAACSDKAVFQAYAAKWLQARVGFDGLLWGKGHAIGKLVAIAEYKLDGRSEKLISDYPAASAADPVSIAFAAAPHRLQNIATHKYYLGPQLQIMRDYLESFQIRHLQLVGLRHPEESTYRWLVLYREDEKRSFKTVDESSTTTMVSLVLAAQHVQESMHGSATSGLDTAAQGIGDSWQRVLTSRQQQILGMLNLGMANKLIAKNLGISENTLKTHLKLIYGHLGVHSRTQAVLKGLPYNGEWTRLHDH